LRIQPMTPVVWFGAGIGHSDDGGDTSKSRRDWSMTAKDKHLRGASERSGGHVRTDLD